MNVQTAADLYRSNPAIAAEADRQWQALLSRSATDVTFRETLIRDPRAAISEFTGREVSEDVDVAFIENKADATIVLPDFVDTSAELSDSELETVAGGAITIPIIVALIIIDTALATCLILDATK